MHIRSAARAPAAPCSGSALAVIGRCVPRVLVVLALAGIVLLGSAGPAVADLPEGVTWTATIDEQNVDRSSSGPAVELNPSKPVHVAIRIENRTQETISVPYVRIEGGVLGLTFYAYTTQVDMEVGPGGVGDREFEVRLLGLGRQASGLMPSKVTLVDAADGEIDAKDMRADIRGDVDSVYTVFGLAVGGVALVLLVGVLWRLTTGRLSPNRWRRGLALAAPGLGLGFLLTFTLSAFRWATPDPELWGALLFGGAVLGFVAGYLSPTPGEADEAETGEEETEGEAATDLLEPGPGVGEVERNSDLVFEPSGTDARAEEETARSHRWLS
jgi:hypothetical protein